MKETATSSLDARLEFLHDLKPPGVLRAQPRESIHALLAGKESWLEHALTRNGAILFRGFGLSAKEFRDLSAQLFGDSFRPYLGGTSPRVQINEGVYESTRFPRSLSLPLHNEMSYLPEPPRRIAFFCDVPAASGGETPLADSREIYQRIPPAVRAVFETSGIRYHRYFYGPGWNAVSSAIHRLAPLHRSWMAAFQTTDRAEVEKICARQGVSVEWDNEDGVLLTNTLPAARQHPVTGETIWFNQATAFLLTPRSAGTLRWLLYQLAWPNARRRPFYASFASGEAITLRQLNDVNEAIGGAATRFAWHRGDLLLLDNYLVAHGRMPFRGQRRILVAMS
jgi:alpha-ketoglutarate-dependent taurine dioxygenase